MASRDNNNNSNHGSSKWTKDYASTEPVKPITLSNAMLQHYRQRHATRSASFPPTATSSSYPSTNHSVALFPPDDNARRTSVPLATLLRFSTDQRSTTSMIDRVLQNTVDTDEEEGEWDIERRIPIVSPPFQVVFCDLYIQVATHIQTVLNTK